MKVQFLPRIAAAVICVLFSSLLFAQTGSLRAGAAKVDISPPASFFPLKDKQQYVGVHDPVYARTLVLDNGATKIALIDIDTTQILHGDDLVKAVTDQLKIPAANVIISATHDHNALSLATGPWGGPTVKSPYYDIVLKGITESVRQANAGLQPARIGFGTGKAYINTNRDQKIGDAYHMGYAPDGPSDKTVAVVLVTKPTGEPIAVYANYPVHSVVMFLAKTKDGQSEITSDLGGWASNYVEDHFKGAVALWSMGPAGDQNPLFMATYNQGAPDVHDEGAAGWAILDVLSRRVGEEIVRITKNIQNTSDKAVLWGGQTVVTCPGQKAAEPGPRKPGMKMVDADPVNITISLIMVNDIAIGGAAAELFNDVAQQIKRNSIFDRFLIATMMPDDVGYVPSDVAFTLPSQMALGNKLKPGCAAPALSDGFQALEKKYLPVLQSAAK